MSKFDIEGAIDRIADDAEEIIKDACVQNPRNVIPKTVDSIRRELRAAVLAGRREAQDAVLSCVQQSDQTLAIASAISSLPDP